MLFICRCPICDSVTEGDLGDSLSRIELDFIDQEIRFVCPSCKKESKMSLLTSNKLSARPLPGIKTMRG